MEGLVQELLRLESAKHKALIEIDALAYDAHVRSQQHILSISRESVGKVTDVEGLLSLSQLITLNKHLLKSLTSTARETSGRFLKTGPKRKAASQCR